MSALFCDDMRHMRPSIYSTYPVEMQWILILEPVSQFFADR